MSDDPTKHATSNPSSSYLRLERILLLMRTSQLLRCDERWQQDPTPQHSRDCEPMEHPSAVPSTNALTAWKYSERGSIGSWQCVPAVSRGVRGTVVGARTHNEVSTPTLTMAVHTNAPPPATHHRCQCTSNVKGLKGHSRVHNLLVHLDRRLRDVDKATNDACRNTHGDTVRRQIANHQRPGPDLGAFSNL